MSCRHAHLDPCYDHLFHARLLFEVDYQNCKLWHVIFVMFKQLLKDTSYLYPSTVQYWSQASYILPHSSYYTALFIVTLLIFLVCQKRRNVEWTNWNYNVNALFEVFESEIVQERLDLAFVVVHCIDKEKGRKKRELLYFLVLSRRGKYYIKCYYIYNRSSWDILIYSTLPENTHRVGWLIYLGCKNCQKHWFCVLIIIYIL